jgi:hypothetical protein
VEIGCVCSKWAYKLELKKHIYLSKENHLCEMLQHVTHFFTLRNQLGCKRHTSCNLGVSRGRYSLFASNRPIELSWRNTCIAMKKNICVWSAGIYHIVSLWEWN